jgi:hypothetical protein
MKRHQLYFALLIPFLVFTLSTCVETIVRDDCENLDEIELVLSARYSTDCNPNEMLPAHGAGFKIIRGNDTLFSGNLDSNGRFETDPIDSSSCGMNNVIVETSFSGKSVREEFGVLCCDTTLQYLFSNVSCSPPDTIDCMSIDTTIVKTITSSGDCVMQNATLKELKNNTVIIASATPVRIDLTELINLSGKIYVESVNPGPVGNEIVLEGNRLEIYFNVDRTSLGTIPPVTINLPTTCLDPQGNSVNTGAIKIIVDASVCDPNNCTCPFGGSKNPTPFYAPESVPVGENKTFPFTIAELSEGNFGKGCTLKIDSIKRTDGSDANIRGANSWIIESTTPSQLKVGEKLTISANFAPVETGTTDEDFEVFTSVYSDADPNTPKNSSACSFLFRLKGESCENNCPQIQILGFNVKHVNVNTQAEKTLFPLEKVDLSVDEIIKQKINAQMSNKCLKEKKEPGLAAFRIVLPAGYYCSDVNLTVQEKKIGAFDDRSRFNSILSQRVLDNNNQSSGLAVYFDPPDLSEYYNTKHDSIYQCGFDLIVTDGSGNEICPRQEIQVIAEVSEFSLKSGDVIPMEAFSQVSTAASIPSYHVYDIDTYNSTLGNYGLRESLTPDFLNFSKNPTTPLSAHSLYFDVDSPNDPVVNFNQKPKLYLVNTAGNNFSRITATPVGIYLTPDDFFAAYENGDLMKSILNGKDPDNFSWVPYSDKSDGGGIEISPYEVYVVWDPELLPELYSVGGDEKRIYCGMALLYISSVKSGSENTDSVTGGNGKASVSFYVEYPVKY